MLTPHFNYRAEMKLTASYANDNDGGWTTYCRVMHTMQTQASLDGRFWLEAHIETIAAICQRSVRQIRRYNDRAVAAKLIEFKQRYRRRPNSNHPKHQHSWMHWAKSSAFWLKKKLLALVSANTEAAAIPVSDIHVTHSSLQKGSSTAKPPQADLAVETTPKIPPEPRRAWKCLGCGNLNAWPMPWCGHCHAEKPPNMVPIQVPHTT